MCCLIIYLVCRLGKSPRGGKKDKNFQLKWKLKIVCIIRLYSDIAPQEVYSRAAGRSVLLAWVRKALSFVESPGDGARPVPTGFGLAGSNLDRKTDLRGEPTQVRSKSIKITRTGVRH